MAHVQRQSRACLKDLLRFSLITWVALLLWQPTVTAQGRGGVLRIGMTAADTAERWEAAPMTRPK
jgi:hypothetical protein